MKLKKEELSLLLEYESKLRQSIVETADLPKMASEEFESMVLDLRVAKAIVDQAETIIFSSDTMRQLLQNIDRIDTRGEFLLPYPYLIIQFTEPILEADMMPFVEISDWQTKQGMDKDWIECLLIANPEQDNSWKRIPGIPIKRNCVAWFTSTSLNRVSWKYRPEHEADIAYAAGLEKKITSESLANKKQLIKIAFLINLFLNAPNVVLKKTLHPVKIQMKREKKGKKKLPEYHTVVIEKTQYESSPSKGTGTAHSHMYPVRGHFRRIPNHENPIWIPNHFRGLAHSADSLRKEIYKVK